MFLVFPGFIFLLSLAGPIVIYVVFVPIAALLLLITMVNLLQRKNPKLLPAKLQNWEFLPEPVRSLEPIDRLVVSCLTRWIFSSIRYFLISLNIREHLPKKMFSFGHCPNEGGRRPLPELKNTIYIFIFDGRKRGRGNLGNAASETELHG